jgi:hypothetical protein
MAVPTLIVEIAFNDNPLVVSPSWIDISSFVQQVSIHRGRSDDFDKNFTSTASLVLNNNTRVFDPFNTTGTYYGKLTPRRQIRIRATANGTTYPIFRGYVNGFPVTWSDAGKTSTVTVECFDTISFLQSTVLKNDFADIFTRSLNPIHYYKCSDPAGNTVIKDFGSASVNLNVVSGRGNETLTAKYSLGLALSGTSADLTNTVYSKYEPSNVPVTGDASFSFWAAFPESTNTEQTLTIGAVTTTSQLYVRAHVPFTGNLMVAIQNDVEISQYETSSTERVASSIPAHYVVTYTASTGAIQIYVNGVNRTSTNGGYVSPLTGVKLFPTKSVSLSDGVFQEVAMFNYLLSNAQIVDLFRYGAGNKTESTSSRVSNILSLSGLPASLYSVHGTSVGEITGSPAPNTVIADALTTAMETEGGYTFVNKSGILTTVNRNYVTTNSTSVNPQIIVSDLGNNIGYANDDISIFYDGDNMRNEIVVEYGGGVQETATDNTAIANFGKHSETISTQLSTSAGATALASFWLGYYSLMLPTVTETEVGTSATTLAKWQQLLSLELLDRFTFIRTPIIGSQFTQDMLINKITFDLAPKRWSMKLNGSARFAPSPPLVSVSAATSVTGSTATLNGLVSANNYSTTMKFQYSTASNFSSFTEITATPSSTINQTVPISAGVTGLEFGTTYYFRVIATNSIGTSTSSSTSLTTAPAAPTANMSTAETTGTGTTATCSAIVSANGALTTMEFQFSTSNTFSTFTTGSATPSTTSSQVEGVFINATGFTVGTTYYVRLKAVNSAGTTYSNTLSWLAGVAPSITMNAVTNFNQNSAVFNATVNPNGSTTSVQFQYSVNNSTWTNSGLVTGLTGGSQAVSVSQSSLNGNTHYWVRAIATNIVGSTTSNRAEFDTYNQRFVTLTSGSGTWTNPVPTSGSSGLAITTIYDVLVVGGGGVAGDNYYVNGGGGGGVAVSNSMTISGNLTYAVGGASTASNLTRSGVWAMTGDAGGNGGTPNDYRSGSAGAGSGGTSGQDSPFREGVYGDLDGETGAATGGGGSGAGGQGTNGSTPWLATIYGGVGGAAVSHFGITVSSGAGGEANSYGSGATEYDGATPFSSYGGGGTGVNHTSARAAQGGLVRFYYYGPA